MDMDAGEETVLRTLAAGGSMNYALWPMLLCTIVEKIQTASRTEFPIPILPPPKPIAPSPEPRLLPTLPSSDPTEPHSSSAEESGASSSSQETNKENTSPVRAPPPSPPQPLAVSTAAAPEPAPTAQDEPGTLPREVISMMNEVTNTLTNSFPLYPPHTIQRLAELVLSPRQHYRHVVAYLHALQRVVSVTSGRNVYPLPPAVADMSTMNPPNGISEDVWVDSDGEGDDVAASASAGLNVGSDEALGGALLTPIPWLQRRLSSGSGADDADGSISPGGSEGSSNSGVGAAVPGQGQAQGQAQIQHQHRPSAGAARRIDGQVRTESTETIDGPNGMGSIETVSVSVNGIPSHGATAAAAAAAQLAAQAQQQQRGVTQGELLRQEQRAGVVPVSQLSRIGPSVTATSGPMLSGVAGGVGAGERREDVGSNNAADEDTTMTEQDSRAEEAQEGQQEQRQEQAEEEVPHARGPEEIGAADMGPQSASSSFVVGGSGGVELHGIDIEAAVGRKADYHYNLRHSRSPFQQQQQTEEVSAQKAEGDDDSKAGEQQSAKREAEEAPPGQELPSKKLREDSDQADEGGAKDAEGEGGTAEQPKRDAEGDVIIGDDAPAAGAGEGEAQTATETEAGVDAEEVGVAGLREADEAESRTVTPGSEPGGST